MQKYFYKLNADGSIYALYKQKTAPSNSVQISKVDYERYKSVLVGIPDREGYDKVVKLYPDFTYTVEYVPIEEVIVE